MNQTTQSSSSAAPDGRGLEFRAALLLLAVVLLVGVSALYLLYARGVFDRTQRLVLLADDSEGVVVGMDMTFAGFPLGRVSGIELSPQGEVRILVDIPRKDAHWLRQSSIFTLERGLVGGTRIRAFSGMLDDPPLPDGAQRKVLVGDAGAEIPRLVSDVRELLSNLRAMTAPDAAINASLGHLRDLTARLQGPQGALGVLFGNQADARKILTALDRTNALLTRLDGLAAHADAQVFGEAGMVKESRAAVVQLQGLLGDARASLRRLDEVLVQAQAVAANAREGTADLGALRAEVESNLRKVEGLVNEINRKWPFARDMEIKLP